MMKEVKPIGVCLLVTMVMIMSSYYYSMSIKPSEIRFGDVQYIKNDEYPSPRPFRKQTGSTMVDNRTSVVNPGSSQRLTNDFTPITADLAQSDTKTNLLIIGRMSSASTATVSLFTKRDDVFHLGEPGLVILKTVYKKHIHIDSAEYLDEMQPYLCKFLGDMFNCNFSSHGTFLNYLNHKEQYRKGGNLAKLNYPITAAELRAYCQSKVHIVAKVLRFSDITPCLPTFQKNKVKVVFLARDPRGLITSRLRRWGPILANLNDGTSDRYYPIANIVKEHCAWLDMVFNLLKNGPQWFIENSMLVRFEDKCLYPDVVNQAVFDFVGILAPTVSSRPESHNESARNWLIAHSYDKMKELQDYCSEHIYNEFGWLIIKNKKEFERARTSWFRPMPQNEVTLKYILP